MSDAKERDWIDYIDIFVRIVASVALPLALFFAGQLVAKQQAIDQDLRRREDRVTDLLRYLASKEDKERLLGISVLQGVSGHGKLPPELSTALIEIATSDDSMAVKKAAFRLVDGQAPSATPTPGGTGQSDTDKGRSGGADGTRRLPARLYFQIVSEDQRDKAREIEKRLENDDLVVPGIQRVPGATLTGSEVRYFWPDDRADAEQIQQRLAALGVPVTVVFPERYARSGRPRHFELWLKPAN